MTFPRATRRRANTPAGSRGWGRSVSSCTTGSACVERATRFASSIAVGFVRVEEEYRLTPQGPGCTLVSDNEVRSAVPGLDWLAVRLTKANVESSMNRLKEFCERQP